MIKESIKKLFSFLSGLLIDRVREGELVKPFFRKVIWLGQGETLWMPIGIHLLGKLYFYIAYTGFRGTARMLVTTKEWNEQYQKGRNYEAELMSQLYGVPKVEFKDSDWKLRKPAKKKKNYHN